MLRLFRGMHFSQENCDDENVQFSALWCIFYTTTVYRIPYMFMETIS